MSDDEGFTEQRRAETTIDLINLLTVLATGAGNEDQTELFREAKRRVFNHAQLVMDRMLNERKKCPHCHKVLPK